MALKDFLEKHTRYTFKTSETVWRDGSVAKSPYKGTRFGSQHIHDDSQPSVNPVPFLIHFKD